MSYQVLARKWRPRTFDQMVGQQHVLRALTNALDQGRVHHAFLFTGTRGVGKTTVARVFAKALNCDVAVSSQPCGKCDSCLAIDEGRFVDLIEVDAASRTRVDDTRELLDNVQYAPTGGRYKVYLIDEVHMLSAHSFNALLKTLEEPPPHVKFLLATTDPQKLPITILSRCLQFNLKRLSEQQISNYLLELLSRESIDVDSAAAAIIATAADGSMRDALSLLDQAIAYGGGKVELGAVREMLGTVDRGQVLSLLAALATQKSQDDATELWSLAQSLQSLSPDFSAVLDEMATCLQAVAVKQVIPAAQSVDDASMDAYQQQLGSLAQSLSPEDTQLFYQIVLHGKRDLPLAPQPRIGFEMTLLRLLAFQPASQVDAGGAGGSSSANSQPAPASKPAGPPPKSSLVAPAANGSAAAAPAQVSDVQQPDYPAKAAEPKMAGPEPVNPDINSPEPNSSASTDFDWPLLVLQLNLRGLAKQLAANCHWLAKSDNKIKLLLSPEHAQIDNDRARLAVQNALSDHFGQPDLQLSIEIGTPAETNTKAPGNPLAVASEKQQPPAAQSHNYAPEPSVAPSASGATDLSGQPLAERPNVAPAEATAKTETKSLVEEGAIEPELRAPAATTASEVPKAAASALPSAEPANGPPSETEQTERSEQAEQRGTARPTLEEVDQRLADRSLGYTLAQREEQVAVNAQQAARDAIEQDPNVLAMQANLGASIRPGSIRPLDP